MEGLILIGGVYLRMEICVSKLIGLVLQLEGNLPFLLCFTLYLRAISKYKSPGGLYLEGDLTESFLRYGFGGLIFGAAYTWRGLFLEFYRNQLWLFSLPELQIEHRLFFFIFAYYSVC